MAGGRPKDEVIDRLKEGWQTTFLEMGREGCSDVEIRAKFNISQDLWERWLEEDAEFSLTAKASKAACHAKWEEMGRKMAFGQVEGNPTTWIFNMKNRFNWRDKQDVEHSGQVDLSSKTDAELKARAEKLLGKLPEA